jgi:hypothetical protein
MNAPKQPAPVKRSVAAIVGGLIALAVGSAFAWFGSRELSSELLLRSNHETVEASVVNARVMQGRKTGTTYEVQYRFNVPGSSETYSKRDETGRGDLWTGLEDEQTWREAQSARRLRVIYRPDDPWVNRPEKAGAMPLGDTVAAVILGLVIAVPGLLLVIFQIAGMRPAPRPDR